MKKISLLFAMLAACASPLASAAPLTPQTVFTFTGASGSYPGNNPMVPPTLAQDGKLYGIAAGTVRRLYQLDLASGTVALATPTGVSTIVHTNILPIGSNRFVFVSGLSTSGNIRAFDTGIFSGTTTLTSLVTNGEAPGSVTGTNAIDTQGNLWIGGNTYSTAIGVPGLTRTVFTADGLTLTHFPFPDHPPLGVGGAVSGGPYGLFPFSLIWSAADQAIYGLSTSTGNVTTPAGTVPAGTVFKFDPAANSGAGAYTRLHVFTEDDGTQEGFESGDGSSLQARASGSASIAVGAVSAIIEIGDWLYGTATGGANIASEIGSIWRMKKDGSQFSVIYHFKQDSGTKGNQPSGTLALGADGNLYGTTLRTGTGTSVTGTEPGTIYRVVLGNIDSAADDRVELVHTFALNGAGANPVPHGLARAEASGAVLVGVTRMGGESTTAASNVGTVFRLDIPPVVSITAFSADKTSLNEGETATLSWTASHANACTASGPADWQGITPDPASGTATVTPLLGNNIYTLRCTDTDGNEASSNVSITASALPVASIDSFTASLATVTAGESVTLTWAVSDAITCTASGPAAWQAHTPSSSSGSFTVTPAEGSNTYTLECQGAGGNDSKSVTVTASRPSTPSSSSGGGAFGPLLLLPLGLLALRRRRHT